MKRCIIFDSLGIFSENLLNFMVEEITLLSSSTIHDQIKNQIKLNKVLHILKLHSLQIINFIGMNMERQHVLLFMPFGILLIKKSSICLKTYICCINKLNSCARKYMLVFFF